MEEKAKARYQRIDRQQIVLEQVDVEQLIGENHAARNIWSLLGEMDLSAFGVAVKAVEGHSGRSSWEPRLLIAIWLYAYSRGMSSARRIARECHYEPALRWLTGLQTINYHTLSDFRSEQGAALQTLFTQVLAMMTLKKLITLERVTVDGTKVRAAVNKKTFSRKQKIAEHLKLAEKHLKELQAEEAEQEKRGRQAAARQRAAKERVQRLEEAAAEVNRLQKEKKWERDKPCQASTSDADAQFMRTSDHGLAPAYNVQLVNDAKNKLIVDVEVSKQPSDSEQLKPALERIRSVHGSYPKQCVADGDYTNRESVIGAAEAGVDYYGSWRKAKSPKLGHGIADGYEQKAFGYDEAANQMICPEGKTLRLVSIQRPGAGLQNHVYAARKEECLACRKRSLCTPQNKMEKHGRMVSRRKEPAALVAYHAKMSTDQAKTIYKQRAPVAEFPNAWLKEKLNWRRVRCRGLEKVKAEALWAALTYNLQRYFKLSALPAQKVAA